MCVRFQRFRMEDDEVSSPLGQAGLEDQDDEDDFEGKATALTGEDVNGGGRLLRRRGKDCVAKLEGHTRSIRGVSFSPAESSLFCSGGYDGLVNFYDASRQLLVNSVSVREQWLAEPDFRATNLWVVHSS